MTRLVDNVASLPYFITLGVCKSLTLLTETPPSLSLI